MNLGIHCSRKIDLLKLSLLVMIFSSSQAEAQLLYPEAVKYRTGFYDNYFSNPDSAIFFARKLASEPKNASFLRQAVHEDIFFIFQMSLSKSS